MCKAEMFEKVAAISAWAIRNGKVGDVEYERAHNWLEEQLGRELTDGDCVKLWRLTNKAMAHPWDRNQECPAL